MLLYPRRLGMANVASAVDQAVVGFYLPPGSVLRKFWAYTEVMPTTDVTVNVVFPYSVAAYLCPVIDPDDGSTIETIWDQTVPKDADLATDGFDLDTENVDTNVFAEWGEFELENLIGFNSAFDAEEKWRYDDILSYPKYPMGFTTGTPDTYLPAARRTTQKQPMTRIDVPSMLILGLGVPDFAETTATAEPVPPEDSQWSIKYASEMLRDAAKALVGLIEVGAESPYEDMMTRLEDYLQAPIFEETAGFFSNSNTLNVHAGLTGEVWVPGDMKTQSNLGTGGF